MNMESERATSQTEHVIASAIRAVERQADIESGKENTERGSKQQQFFGMLDRHAENIFASIADQARQGQHVFYFTTLPRFRAQCDNIFAKGFGDFPSEMVNRWLYARDLKHLFHCNGNTIVW